MVVAYVPERSGTRIKLLHRESNTKMTWITVEHNPSPMKLDVEGEAIVTPREGVWRPFLTPAFN